ncbi:glycosyltransferase [Bordetella petrii]|uniref:glycosyltransferase n=1 Tax=Bordetella petrii TaxID=94624 RepID=UPI001E48776E|nr:glycosyltransferase [Bordetella petrii]MCD0504141.1 glycosyltransferase [Bordetella petrii]
MDKIKNAGRALWRGLKTMLGTGAQAPMVPPEPAPRTARQQNDIDWPTFRDTVLSRRGEFKGVFIQNRTIDWDVPLFQRPQHMCTAFGKLGYLVIYRTINGEFDDVIGFRDMGHNVWLTSSPEIDGIEGALRSIYSTVDATPSEALSAFRAKGKIIYEYIDHIDEAVSGAGRLHMLAEARDHAFAGGVDYIIASARALEQEALAVRPREQVVYVPNGVDCAHYRQDWSSVQLPEAYSEFLARHDKIIGYFGALAPWLWYDAIAELVARRPDCGFVFIGPDYFGGSQQLPQADNFIWLGPIDYRVLPAYAQQFDVALIPFAHSDVARTTSPLKLFEYFAMEVPVVVTSSMDECRAYPQVLVAEDVEQYSAAIDEALGRRTDPEFRSSLARLADANDWTVRAASLEHLFREVN